MFILLLTGCINPSGMVHTHLIDHEVRKRQYVEAIEWYLVNTSLPIVFVENSLNDISAEFTSFIDSGRLEVLTFDGNNYNRDLGKGYGEALIIDYGLKHSNLISKYDDTSIIKITGRYICKNINDLLEMHNNKTTIYANISKDINNGSNIAISSIFISPLLFLQDYFLPSRDSLNDSIGYVFENLLYDSITRWKKDKLRFREFWVLPCITGMSGTFAVTIDTPTYTMKIKHKLMYILHRFFNYRGFLNPFRKKRY